MDAIFRRPIDGQSANKRMVGRKLEMSTRSGSNYLTLAGRVDFGIRLLRGGLKTRIYVHSSFAIILIRKRELVALLSLSSWCLVMVVWLFLAVPWVCLRFVIVVFSDHNLLFLTKLGA